MIRHAVNEDAEKIMEIYKKARDFMIQTHNPTQWRKGYPSLEIVYKDMENNNLYVVERDGEIAGVFAFIPGKDKTYNSIEGRWISDTPYYTIHRIASDGRAKGIMDETMKFCSDVTDHIRIDTHRDNKIMQKLILKNGFTRCGIIYVADGTPRIAYEKAGRRK